MSKSIYQVLKDLDIPYEEYEHPAVFTCEEADRYCPDLPGGKSKNLFLSDGTEEHFFLVILESHKRLDFKTLAGLLHVNKLKFASEEQLKKILGLSQGAVSPFGLINDAHKKTTVVIDKQLLEHDQLHYHPCINTATLVLRKEYFLKFLQWCGNETKIIEL